MTLLLSHIVRFRRRYGFPSRFPWSWKSVLSEHNNSEQTFIHLHCSPKCATKCYGLAYYTQIQSEGKVPQASIGMGSWYQESCSCFWLWLRDSHSYQEIQVLVVFSMKYSNWVRNLLRVNSIILSIRWSFIQSIVHRLNFQYANIKHLLSSNEIQFFLTQIILQRNILGCCILRWNQNISFISPKTEINS